MAATLIAESNRAIVDSLAQCVEACNSCHYNCNTGHESMAECARLCLDCAAICEHTHALLSRDSRWAPQVAVVAARVSAGCAAECEKFEDEFCRQCVTSCREAARHSQELAQR
jgi:hypothetical protein